MTILPGGAGGAMAIVFDFDGVLVDSEAAHGTALLAAAARLGLEAPDGNPNWYVGLGDAECFRRMAAAAGRELDDFDLRLLVDQKSEAFGRLCQQGGIAAFAGAAELVREAAARVPVAVCSGSRRSDIEPSLATLGLLPLLATVVTADDVNRTKPDPEPYLRTASRLGLDPEQCVAIEDSPAGVAAARAAGYRRVHAVCHTFGREQLHEAHEIYGCIAELPVAKLLL